MSRVYLMSDDSSTEQLTRIHCTNEDTELQRLLELNLNLLPGDQISPKNKLRWLMIRREMPVTDPASGAHRWSIDFFLVDQFGVPTLVECKRCNDSRTRREVVGQMLEYAANGSSYWSAADMRSHAQSAAGGADQLLDKLEELTEGRNVEEFFATMERHLLQGKIRLIFFLEDSPLELRSMVDFLNKQLKETEVLLVEARQYAHSSGRIVVPWLFGFTEEARVAKRESTAELARVATVRGEAGFLAAIGSVLPQSAGYDQLRAFIDEATSIPGYRAVYLRGCAFLFLGLHPERGLFGIRRNGALELYFGNWHRDSYTELTENQERLCRRFQEGLEDVFKVKFSDKQLRGFPQFQPEVWLSRKVEVLAVLSRLVEPVRHPSEPPSLQTVSE